LLLNPTANGDRKCSGRTGHASSLPGQGRAHDRPVRVCSSHSRRWHAARPSGATTGDGATVAHVDEQSVRDIPGLMKVVVRKDFVGVVAQTQYQAVVAARQLVVRWNAGPSLPAQKTFFEHLQQQPSHDALSVDSRDVEANLLAPARGAGEIYLPYQMHGSVAHPAR